MMRAVRTMKTMKITRTAMTTMIIRVTRELKSRIRVTVERKTWVMKIQRPSRATYKRWGMAIRKLKIITLWKLNLPRKYPKMPPLMRARVWISVLG
jgi:hypothetical protein